MGEEFALLNDLAAEQVWGVFEEIWDLIFLSTPSSHSPQEPWAVFPKDRKKNKIKLKNLILFNHQEAAWSIVSKTKITFTLNCFPWRNKSPWKEIE